MPHAEKFSIKYYTPFRIAIQYQKTVPFSEQFCQISFMRLKNVLQCVIIERNQSGAQPGEVGEWQTEARFGIYTIL